MIKSLFIAIVGGLALWFLQDYFRDVPTATYSISSAIEIPGSAGSNESAQEITIENPGRSAVKAISIKVPRHITSYKLGKHSNLAKEEISSDVNSFELVYPELPQGQRISLLIRYNGGPIDKSLISINHANGIAQVQTTKTSSIDSWWIWIAFVTGILSQVILDIRRLRRESFIKWTNVENVYRNNKPWYASSAEWSKMQFEAIRKCFDAYSSSIDQSSSYILLNREKPTLLNAEDWTKLQQIATGDLAHKFENFVTIASNVEKLIDLYKLKKPVALANHVWTAFQDRLYMQIVDRLLPRYMDEAGYISLLERNNLTLKLLPDPIAEDIRKLVQKKYSEYLVNGSKYSKKDDPSVILRTARFDLLANDESKFVKNSIERSARMKAMPETWDIDFLKRFVNKEKPEWMGDQEFSSICDLVARSENLANEANILLCQKNELKTNQVEVDTLMKRVIKQLDLIDRVLTLPSSIEKIEDYDKTFAVGNRKNLELVASLLNSQNHPDQYSPSSA